MDAVQLARRLIQFDTTNPPGREEEIVRYLAHLLTAAGFDVTMDPFGEGRANCVARLNPKADGRPLCFAGHLDTVPVGEAAWTYAPHEGIEHEGKLFGRGASDMKSGIAAMCAAALELAHGGFAEELCLFMFGGEETGCTGSFHLASQPELLGTPGGVVVTEPTGNRPLVGHKGAFWLQGEVRGRTAHGSMPELGDNALYKALDVINRLREMSLPASPHPYLGSPTLSVNMLQAGQNTNSVPDLARFRIDMRTIPELDHGALFDAVQARAGESCTWATLLDIPAVWTPPETPWVQRVYAISAPHLDRAPAIETVQFFTDAAALRKHLPETPMVIMGPGDPAQAHQTDEYCLVAEIHTAAELYKSLLLDWRN